jgi:hypothetical protein
LAQHTITYVSIVMPLPWAIKRPPASLGVVADIMHKPIIATLLNLLLITSRVS